MNERATLSKTTSGGHTVVYKSYATGREYNEIEQVYLSSAKVSLVGAEPKIEGFSPTVEQDATKKMVEVLVVSVSGENVDPSLTPVEQILDLPYNEYVEIVDALKEVSGKKKATA